MQSPPLLSSVVSEILVEVTIDVVTGSKVVEEVEEPVIFGAKVVVFVPLKVVFALVIVVFGAKVVVVLAFENIYDRNINSLRFL